MGAEDLLNFPPTNSADPIQAVGGREITQLDHPVICVKIPYNIYIYKHVYIYIYIKTCMYTYMNS